MWYAFFKLPRETSKINSIKMCWEYDADYYDALTWCNCYNWNAPTGSYPVSTDFDDIQSKTIRVVEGWGYENMYFIVGYDDETGETNVYDVN